MQLCVLCCGSSNVVASMPQYAVLLTRAFMCNITIVNINIVIMESFELWHLVEQRTAKAWEFLQYTSVRYILPTEGLVCMQGSMGAAKCCLAPSVADSLSCM